MLPQRLTGGGSGTSLLGRAHAGLARVSEWACGPAGSRAQAAAVWAATSAMGAFFLWAVAHFGVNAPAFDEWQDTVPLLADPDRFSPARLWAPHNEHRIPLPRLWLLAVLGLSGNDFRAAMFLNAVLLVAGTGLAVWTAARVRGGRTRLTDLFLPLCLLNPAGVENNLWAFQITFISSAFLFLVLLSLILLGRFTAGGVPAPRNAILSTAVLLSLSMCGSKSPCPPPCGC